MIVLQISDNFAIRALAKAKLAKASPIYIFNKKLYMKFTQQQFSDALKAKLTENGKHLSISEKTLQVQSDNLYGLLVNEETELDDLVTKTLPLFATLNGNYEKDNADFIKKWEKEHPTTTPAPQKTEGVEKNEPHSEEMKAIMKRLQELEEKNAAAEAETLVKQKRSELLAKFKEKNIKDEKWTEKYLSKINISKDTDIEKEATDALDFYNLSHAKYTTRTPGTGGGGGDTVKGDHWKSVLDGILPD